VCNKGLVIHRGETAGITSVEDACRTYEDNNILDRLRASPSSTQSDDIAKDYGGVSGGTGAARITKVEVLSEGRPISSIEYGQTFTLRYHLTIRERIEEGILRILIDSEINKAIAVVDNYEVHRSFLEMPPGDHVYDVNIIRPQLRPGLYKFNAAIISRVVGVHIFFEYGQAQIAIKCSDNNFFYADFRASVQLNAEYTFAKGIQREAGAANRADDVELEAKT
jgi:lipopolysaccharide transport system ATP-binding protein